MRNSTVGVACAAAFRIARLFADFFLKKKSGPLQATNYKEKNSRERE